MKPIVLATDGSPSAAEATLEAVALARALETTIVAVSVEHPPYAGAGYYGYAEVLAELAKGEAVHVEHTLAQTSAVAAEARIDCDVVHARGSVADEICRVAAVRKARMIVMGAHGWSPVRRVLNGSVSTAVVHQAKCPVLVVRGTAEPIVDGVAVVKETAAS